MYRLIFAEHFETNGESKITIRPLDAQSGIQTSAPPNKFLDNASTVHRFLSIPDKETLKRVDLVFPPSTFHSQTGKGTDFFGMYYGYLVFYQARTGLFLAANYQLPPQWPAQGIKTATV